MKNGYEFENLTKEIFAQLIKNPTYEKVEHNVMLDGKDGPRQIDVLITGLVVGVQIKTIIECKDYKSKVSVGVIDALHSVLEDVNANKGIVVSSNGFSRTAKQKAKRLGISLYTAHEAKHDKWSIDLEIPVLITEIMPSTFEPSFYAKYPKGTRFKLMPNVNDFDLQIEFAEYWNSLTLKDIDQLSEFGNLAKLKKLYPPFHVRDVHGNKFPVRDLLFKYDIEHKFYFGYLNEQNNARVLKNILDEGYEILVNKNDMLNYKNNFQKIKFDEIPSFNKLHCTFLVKKPAKILDFENLELNL